MAKAKKTKTNCICKTQRYCFLGVLLILFFIAGGVGFCVLFHGHKTALHSFSTGEIAVAAQSAVQSGAVPHDLFLSTITDFYTNIIVMLTVFIGILSVIGFLYIKNISSKEVFQEVEGVIAGEHFKSLLNASIKEAVKKHIEDNSDLSDIIEKYGSIDNLSDIVKKYGEIANLPSIVEKYGAIADIESRIIFLEKAVSNNTDTIAQADLGTGGITHGSDKTTEQK